MEQFSINEGSLFRKPETDLVVDTLEEAITKVQKGAEYATVFPLHDWDVLNFEKDEEKGVFMITVEGQAGFVGAAKSENALNFGQRRAS